MIGWLFTCSLIEVMQRVFEGKVFVGESLRGQGGVGEHHIEGGVWHGRMARGGHGLPKVSPGPAMPDPSTPKFTVGGWLVVFDPFFL
jgi:hypothetical protein